MPLKQRFFFEKQWLLFPKFPQLVINNWDFSLQTPPHSYGMICDQMDLWQSCIRNLRSYLRGWGANLDCDLRAKKKELGELLKILDERVDLCGLSEPEWAFCYELEAELTFILRCEELYWQQRGRQQWILEGDANTAFFHAMANGRRRRCSILVMKDGNETLRDPVMIQRHIYDFYKRLMGTAHRGGASLGPLAWSSSQIDAASNNGLTAPVTLLELEQAVFSTKSDTAPGPDGIPVFFYKHFWPLVRQQLFLLLESFVRGFLPLKRLNYGILSLIPKVVGADQISQFRPIALINVSFKFLSKVFATRLAPVAHSVIHQAQSAFIKGRSILDGIATLHEILHESNSSKEQFAIFKIDFEKAYDTVSWDFLEEVLFKKGFDPLWVSWIMQLVKGGHTAVNIEGFLFSCPRVLSCTQFSPAP
jgi:hypothetical protein